jgi:hypothetical protein
MKASMVLSNSGLERKERERERERERELVQFIWPHVAICDAFWEAFVCAIV